MVSVHVSMIVRNEADRHLAQTLLNALEIVRHSGGLILATDDCSTDDTLRLLQDAGAHTQASDEPLFWQHEGRARQRHQEWVDLHCSPGDWVLALDADETINKPELVYDLTERARAGGKQVIGLPLYEFWTPTEYRVDGFWFGTRATRLYQWQQGGQIADASMACGAEPTYVRSAALVHGAYQQDEIHLLHWGYLREQDRLRKWEAYTKRLGGHGHNNDHVASIVTSPSLRQYVR